MIFRLLNRLGLTGDKLAFPDLFEANEIGVTVQLVPPSDPDQPPRKLRRSAILGFIAASLIFLTPLVAYWPAIFHYYGLRDSYSNLREAHEEPGKLIHFCASHARPIYGWLLEISLRRIDTIRQLQWIRMLSALLLGAISFASYRLLRRIGWSVGSSLLLALWLGLLPSAQVIAGWAIGWPYSVAVLMALGAFPLAETAVAGGRLTLARAGWLVGAIGLLAASAIVYQPNALFYLVPLTAALIVRRDPRQRDRVYWMFRHVAVVTMGLSLAYGFMRACYGLGVFEASARIAFERQWGDKLLWFATEPLPNALSLFVINDNNGHDRIAYLAGALVAGGFLVAGLGLEWRHRGRARGLVWLAGLLGLPLFAFAISLLAAERYATYRTIFPLTGVLLCWLIASLRLTFGRLGPGTRRMGALLLIATALVVARRRAYALLAVPQGNEWGLVLDGARKVRLETARPGVFLIEPTPEDISTATIYHDEFGSLSANSDWVPKEMFKRAMHDLHPRVPRLDQRYRFASGPRLPEVGHFDVVIDLRELRNLRTEN
jgi:hypothetical protein